MTERIDVDQVTVPGHQSWFFEEVCRGDTLEYLKNRRLLEATLFTPRTTWAKALDETSPWTYLVNEAAREDEAWESDFTLNGVKSLHGKPVAKTEFLALRDKDNLYVVVKCRDPEGSRWKRQ